jgi:hypothetical protein
MISAIYQTISRLRHARYQWAIGVHWLAVQSSKYPARVTAKSLIVTPVWILTVGVAPASKYTRTGSLKMVTLMPISGPKKVYISGRPAGTGFDPLNVDSASHPRKTAVCLPARPIIWSKVLLSSSTSLVTQTPQNVGTQARLSDRCTARGGNALEKKRPG